jgi:hypothetical protein
MPVDDTTAGRVNTPISTPGLIDIDHIYDEVCTAYWCGLNQLTHARAGCDQAPSAGQARTGKRPVRRSQGYPWAETTAGHEGSPADIAYVKQGRVTPAQNCAPTIDSAPPWGASYRHPPHRGAWGSSGRIQRRWLTQQKGRPSRNGPCIGWTVDQAVSRPLQSVKT